MPTRQDGAENRDKVYCNKGVMSGTRWGLLLSVIIKNGDQVFSLCQREMKSQTGNELKGLQQSVLIQSHSLFNSTLL